MMKFTMLIDKTSDEIHYAIDKISDEIHHAYR
mgnify:CR=1 FL=1